MTEGKKIARSIVKVVVISAMISPCPLLALTLVLGIFLALVYAPKAFSENKNKYSI